MYLKKKIRWFLIFGLLKLVFSDAWAQSNKTTEERIEILEEEIDKLKSGEIYENIDPEETSKYGVGPAASKVYKQESGFSVGGYGEIHYEHFVEKDESGNPAPGTKKNVYDALRGVLYFGNKFNDWILFNSEIEIEHADEIFLEFAYLDFLLHPALNVRMGLLLLPLGILNQLHESPTFFSVNRPVTEKVIIPSTWRENGIGIFGTFLEDINYSIYMVNGLKGENFSSAGLRGGRQKGSKALAEGLAGSFSLNYTGVLGLLLGISGYYGESSQSKDNDFKGLTQIYSAHLEYKFWGFAFRSLIAYALVSDVSRLDLIDGEKDETAVGEALLGFYFEFAYDVLNLLNNSHRLYLFVRYEEVDTQHEVASGYEKDPSQDQQIITLGVSYKPILEIAIKADHEIHLNANKTGLDQINVGMSYLF